MPEHIRALVVILLIATVTFAISKKVLVPTLSNEQFSRWRNAWFAVTLIAFLSHNFWIYIFVSGLVIAFFSKRESNKIALFFVLLFAAPWGSSSIAGFGGINYFFEINHFRLLALILLLPAFISLVASSGTLKFGKNLPDKLFALYLILIIALEIRGTTATDSLRQAMYAFTDVFLPYYVISRYLKQFEHLKNALIAFVIAASLLAALAVFESVKGWLLYSSLPSVWSAYDGMGNYLRRDNYLRALVSLGHPIVLGYVLVVAIGFYLFIKQSIHNEHLQRLGLFMLLGGLAATLSRGPWVGGGILLIMFILTGPHIFKRLAMLIMGLVIVTPLISVIPGGERVINLLPFIGKVETGSIDYREKLLENSITVISRNPLFGSVDYLRTPEMQEMVQGEGIIDLVNTYIQIGLRHGLVGLGLFVGIFLGILFGIYRCRKNIPDKTSELYLLGRSLIATLSAVLVIIFTVSSIGAIPLVYWSLAGIGVAYISIVKGTLNSQKPV